MVFLGNSLMLQGIIPSELADAIGVDRGDVKNLAMHGALPWDLAWLVDRMEEPRADGPRIAAINIDRAGSYRTTCRPRPMVATANIRIT